MRAETTPARTQQEKPAKEEQTAAIVRSLVENPEFVRRVRGEMGRAEERSVSEALAQLVEEIRESIVELIRQQVEHELRELIEDNNRILRQIQTAMRPLPAQEVQEDMSFSEVHRLMSEERQRIQQEVNDASLDKSISAFVELKVETIEERVGAIDRRLRGMEDKYETNLNSIWNVLSITESAIFDHLKDAKQRPCNPREQPNPQNQNEKEKTSILGFFKFGK